MFQNVVKNYIYSEEQHKAVKTLNPYKLFPGITDHSKTIQFVIILYSSFTSAVTLSSDNSKHERGRRRRTKTKTGEENVKYASSIEVRKN